MLVFQSEEASLFLLPRHKLSQAVAAQRTVRTKILT